MSGRIEKVEDQHYRVVGEMVFTDAVALLAEAEKMLDGPGEIQLDLSQVSRADSAGLAVVLEWFRMAHAKGIKINLEQVPDKLDALARICEVHGMLGLPRTDSGIPSAPSSPG